MQSVGQRLAAIVGVAVFLWVGGMLDASLANTASARILEQGGPQCGGVVNGKIQPRCNAFSKAGYVGKAKPDCPNGSFFDIGTWACWTCPPGYNRTANNVAEWDACSRAVPPKPLRAKFHYKTGCPAGTFFDPGRGGGCWSCPGGTNRTAAAVWEWNACTKGVFSKPTRAISHGKPKTCGAGMFQDPRNGGECWSCPQGANRTLAPVTANNACEVPGREDLVKAQLKSHVTCPPGQIFDFKNGGTCWKCPPMYARTMDAVDSPKACQNTSLVWKMPVRQTFQGVFAVPGAETVAVKLLNTPAKLNKMLGAMAQTRGLKADELKQAFAEELKNPHTSPILASLIAGHTIEAFMANTMGRAETMVFSALVKFMQETRIIVAQEALNQYDNWLLAQNMRARDRNRRGGDLQALTHIGYVPPDFKSYAADLLGGAGATTFLGGVMMMTTSYLASPYALHVALESAGVLSKIFPNAASMAVSGKFAGLSSAGAAMSSVAGPMIVITGSTIIASVALDKVIKATEARPKLVSALNAAKRPINMKAHLRTKGGLAEAITNFGAMIRGAPPKRSTLVAKAVQAMSGDATQRRAAVPAHMWSWSQVPGSGHDIAIADDGGVWLIGTDSAQGGYSIWHRPPRAPRWARVPGAATRIAVAGNQAWIVNNAGTIYRRDGNAWTPIDGPKAHDIGASAKGVWIIGVPRPTAGDPAKSAQTGAFGTANVKLGVDGAQAYQWTGTTWAPSSKNGVRIAVEATGRPWVVTESGEVFRHAGSIAWKTLAARGPSGPVQDIAALPGGRPVIVRADGSVAVFDPDQKAWASTEQAGRAVAAGPDGRIWRIGAKNEIYVSQ